MNLNKQLMTKDRLCKLSDYIWAAQNHDLWSWVYCWEVCLVWGGYEGSDQETASF